MKYQHRQTEMFPKRHPGRRKTDRCFLVQVLNTMGAAYVLFYLSLGMTFALITAANDPPEGLSLSNRDTAELMAFVNTSRRVLRSPADVR